MITGEETPLCRVTPLPVTATTLDIKRGQGVQATGLPINLGLAFTGLVLPLRAIATAALSHGSNTKNQKTQEY